MRKEYLLMKTIININRVCNNYEYLILLNVVNLMTSITEQLLFEIEPSDWEIIAKQSFCFDKSVKFFCYFHVIRLSSSIFTILIQRERYLKKIEIQEVTNTIESPTLTFLSPSLTYITSNSVQNKHTKTKLFIKRKKTLFLIQLDSLFSIFAEP